MTEKRFWSNLDAPIKNILLAQIRDLWTHTSTALEGNSLSLGDTAFILEEGLTIAGKSLKDHREVYDHSRAIELIYRFLKLDKITEMELFELNKAILTERVLDIYQPVGAWKSDSNFTYFTDKDGKQRVREYPSPDRIELLMTEWLEKLNNTFGCDLTKDEAVATYASLHLEFVTIHPFADGNGRMARLLANLPVLKAGFPPIVIPTAEKNNYRAAISEQQEKITDLPRLVSLNKIDSSGFTALCEGYWSETIALINTATALSHTRRAIRAARELESSQDLVADSVKPNAFF
jgi:Fic family protein